MKKKWTILAREPRAHIFPTILYWLGVLRSGKILKIPIRRMYFLYQEHTLTEAVESRTLIKVGNKILRLLSENNQFLNRIVKENKRRIPILLAAAGKFTADLSNKTDTELIKLWESYTEKFQQLMAWSAMGTILEYEYPLLSKHLERVLGQKIDAIEKVGRAMSVLSTPTQVTSSKQEIIDLLTIKLCDQKSWDGKLRKHWQKYYWIAFGYDGPGWSLDDIYKRFDELSEDKQKIKLLVKEEKGQPKLLKTQQIGLVKKYRLDSQEARLFHTLRSLGFWKFERKFMLQKTQAQAELFIKEVAKRKYCSVAQLKMLAPWEMKTFIVKDNPSIEILNQRIKSSVVEMKGLKAQILIGQKASKIAQAIINSLKVDRKIKEFKGDVVYPGRVVGYIKLIEQAEQMSGFKKGEILVSSATNPELIPAMKKAAAIITDVGGITSHAAIISRELKTPCVIGTRIATRVLKNGDKVEVDATRGIIKKL